MQEKRCIEVRCIKEALHSASLIQRTFLGYLKMYFVANCTLYQGFTILALEMLP